MNDKPSSEREKAFCLYFLKGHNQTDAAKLAGFSEATANQKGYAMRRQFEKYLADEVIGELRGSGAEALDVLKHLAMHAKQESVRLKAATSLLSYGGFKPVERLEVKVEDRTEKELDAALKNILGDDVGNVLGKLN